MHRSDLFRFQSIHHLLGSLQFRDAIAEQSTSANRLHLLPAMQASMRFPIESPARETSEQIQPVLHSCDFINSAFITTDRANSIGSIDHSHESTVYTFLGSFPNRFPFQRRIKNRRGCFVSRCSSTAALDTFDEQPTQPDQPRLHPCSCTLRGHWIGSPCWLFRPIE